MIAILALLVLARELNLDLILTVFFTGMFCVLFVGLDWMGGI